jgi:uncharacterized protein YcbK (DUF882 family)/LysM repeat protein
MLSIFFGSGSPRGARAGGSLWAAALLALALGAPLPAAAADLEHKVSKGQTLGRIAKRYRTTVDALREVNGLKPGQQIRPGLVLIIPEKGKEAEAAKKAAALRKDKEKDPDRRRSGGSGDEPQASGKDKGKRGDKDRQGDAGRKGDARGDAGRKGDADRRDRESGFARKPKKPGFVRMVRGGELLEMQLLTRDGRLVPKALPKLSRLLRSPAGAIPIDPRLATLVGMVSNHFGGRTIRVVSGYRPYSPTQYTPHSNHNVGRAMDFMVEGVPNTIVRDFCRNFRNTGVGYYPNSTFVHLDVRAAKVYWVDYSRPGEPPRYDRAGGHVAADEAARDVTLPTEGSTPADEDGSKTTQPSDPQGVDSTGGITSDPDPGSDVRGEKGSNRPPPPAAPAPVPHGTPAQQRE